MGELPLSLAKTFPPFGKFEAICFQPKKGFNLR
jgi:hypothetical protein